MLINLLRKRIVIDWLGLSMFSSYFDAQLVSEIVHYYTIITSLGSIMFVSNI